MSTFATVTVCVTDNNLASFQGRTVAIPLSAIALLLPRRDQETRASIGTRIYFRQPFLHDLITNAPRAHLDVEELQDHIIAQFDGEREGRDD